MCGITAIICKETFTQHHQLTEMNNKIIHRGPDGEGTYTDKQVGLAHRRLSIIDLSEQGTQPMTYQDRFVITYNGEIYNYRELKETLQKHGYSFHTNTDTEVILAAYAHWGDECVSHFNGMWAFLIYDKLKQTIFASRDRFGIKPLYYRKTNDAIYFGSEIKQLTPKEEVGNKQMLVDFLIYSYSEHSNETFFKHIFCVKLRA